jgi:catechol 2,3-dioxygenase-like lactoylglutathione lyase family enzyme
MSTRIHHVTVFVVDLEKALGLFQGILGLELKWRLPEVGGRRMSAVLGLENMKAEMAYLTDDSDQAAVELVRLFIDPPPSPRQGITYSGTGLSLTVENLEKIHDLLTAAGFSPFTRPVDMLSPEGQPIKMFCFRTEEGLLIELFEKT